MAHTVSFTSAATPPVYGRKIYNAAKVKSKLWGLLRNQNEGSGGVGVIQPQEEKRGGTFYERYDARLNSDSIGQTEVIVDQASYVHADELHFTIMRVAKSVEIHYLDQSKIDIDEADRAADKLTDWTALQLDKVAAYLLLPSPATLTEGDSGATFSANLKSFTASAAYLDTAHIGLHSSGLTKATHRRTSAIFSNGDAGAIVDPAATQWTSLMTSTNKFTMPFADDVYQKALQEGKGQLQIRVNGITHSGYILAVGGQAMAAIQKDTLFQAERRYATIEGPKNSPWFNVPVGGLWYEGLAIIPLQYGFTDLSYGTVLRTEDIGSGWVKQCGYLLSEECLVSRFHKRPRMDVYKKDVNDELNVAGLSMYLGGAKMLDLKPAASSTIGDAWERPMYVCYTCPAMTAS